MNENIAFSVIIPHRNIPLLLRRCLASIPKRPDVQVIVVDDGSDSGIVDFQKFPWPKDLYVELLLAKERKGAGHARNLGIKRARGKWLIFADADDSFTEGMNKALDRYQDAPEEILYFPVESVDSDTLTPTDRGEYWSSLLNRQNREDLRYLHVVPWGKFFKKALVDREKILFDEVPFSNDMMFATKAGHFAREIGVSREVIYCVTARKGSLSSLQTAESLLPRFEVYLRKNAFLKSVGKKEYIVPIAPAVLEIGRRAGIGSFCKAMRLVVHYRNNLFFNKRSNFFVAVLVHFLRRKEKSSSDKYVVKR